MVVFDLKHGELSCMRGIEPLQHQRRYYAANQRLIEGMMTEEIGDFLDTEHHPADRGAKGNANASAGASDNELPVFDVAATVQREKSRDDMSNTGCDVDEWSFLADAHTAGH